MSDPHVEIEQSLVGRARRGDHEALREVVERAYPVVRRWAFVHTGDPADADDLTQEVLVRVIRRLETYRGGSKFSTWLYAMTRNAAADRYRKARRRGRMEEDPKVMLELTPERPDGPERDLRRSRLRRVLRAFFRELPERQREVFDLCDLQGLSSPEAAERLGIEPVSVRAHLFKARRRMREEILARAPELVEEVP